MAEPDNGKNNAGSNDRVTVSLVAAQLAEVRAIVKGHADTSAATLKAIDDRLAGMVTLPQDVADLKARVLALEKSRAWMAGTFPMIFLGVIMAIVAIVTLVVR